MCKSLNLLEQTIAYFKHNPRGLAKLHAAIAQKLKNARAYYHDEVIDFICQPFFVTQAEIDGFKKITGKMFSIIRKTTKEYCHNHKFRRKFPFSPIMQDMIQIEPGYSNPVPIARFDIFYNSKDDFKFCELNGDGTSAMNETNSLEKAILNSNILTEIFPDYQFTYFELFESWLKELLQIYRQWGGKNKPVIAIVDFESLGTVEEFRKFQEVFQTAGYQTYIVDPRKFSYNQGNLLYKNVKIDLVYRRAVNREIEKHRDEIEDFQAAYRDKAVCVVGPYRSQIMHNKAFFAILKDEKNHYLFNNDELEFIKKHIPQTFLLNNKKIRDFALQNKYKLVLKPMDYYAARNVAIGVDSDIKSWEKLIDNALQTKNYLIQEFCPPPEQKLLSESGNFAVDNLNPKLESFKNTLGLFVYNGKFKGIYHRIGRKNVIASNSEAIVRPNIIVKDM